MINPHHVVPFGSNHLRHRNRTLSSLAALVMTFAVHAQSNCVEDLDGDGKVGGGDLALVLLS